VGPCSPLITADDVLGCCSLNQDDDDWPPSDEAVASAVAAASFVAWVLGGRRHGVCEITGERPGRVGQATCCGRQQVAYPTSPGVGGSWMIPSCGCGSGCGCRDAATATLGCTPVHEITEIRIGGETLDPSAYTLVQPNTLIRRDGGLWPLCQQLGDDDDDPGVLVVDYTCGEPIDAFGLMAIGRFGCELLKACSGKPCQLPTGVTSMVRQGVAISVIDPMEYVKEGRTGVYEFDLWRALVNPNRQASRSTVWSPDVDEAVRGG
jgi:hypothetical protein